jgi:hypothetical protein
MSFRSTKRQEKMSVTAFFQQKISKSTCGQYVQWFFPVKEEPDSMSLNICPDKKSGVMDGLY